MLLYLIYNNLEIRYFINLPLITINTLTFKTFLVSGFFSGCYFWIHKRDPVHLLCLLSFSVTWMLGNCVSPGRPTRSSASKSETRARRSFTSQLKKSKSCSCFKPCVFERWWVSCRCRNKAFLLSPSHLQENVEKMQAEIRRLRAELDEKRMEAERCKVYLQHIFLFLSILEYFMEKCKSFWELKIHWQTSNKRMLLRHEM